MNYQAIYDRIIERNRNTPKIKKQTEDHHIIPRSFAKLDGIEDIDGAWNRVNLPLREHFVVHLLLARIWRSHKVKGSKMAYAFNRMSFSGKYKSKDYAWLRLNYSVSEETKMKISQSQSGKVFSVEHRENLSKSHIGKKRSPESVNASAAGHKGRKCSDETKSKMSNAAKGRKNSTEAKAKMSSSHQGKTHSEETKLKMSESAKKQKSVSHKLNISLSKKGIPCKKHTCHICNKEIGGKSNFNRHLAAHS